jgi:hypothetical protein
MALERVKSSAPKLDAALRQEYFGRLTVVSAEVHHVNQFQMAGLGIGSVARAAERARWRCREFGESGRYMLRTNLERQIA